MTTATQTREFTIKGRTFTSEMTDQECYNRMVQIGQAGGFTGGTLVFARDLARGFLKHNSWTERQQPYAHNLVLEYDAKQAPKPDESYEGFKSIVEHMIGCRARRDQGGKGLKNPAIRIELGPTKFTLKLAGNGSKRPNHVSVSESHRFGEGAFFGWITPEGEYLRYSKAGADVLSLLRRVAVDPARVISEIGRESGLCCYCNASLSQVQSKIAGCGKHCSEKWNVWYPNAEETRSFLVDNPEILVGSTDADRWLVG